MMRMGQVINIHGLGEAYPTGVPHHPGNHLRPKTVGVKGHRSISLHYRGDLVPSSHSWNWTHCGELFTSATCEVWTRCSNHALSSQGPYTVEDFGISFRYTHTLGNFAAFRVEDH